MAILPDKPVTCPVLVGRAAHLDALERALHEAAGGRGQTVLIGGEAGIGKSRLAAEARTRAGQLGMLALEGHCFEPDRSLPYAPLLDLLRTHFAGRSRDEVAEALGPAAPELVKLLPELGTLLPHLQPSPSLGPEAEQRRLFYTIAQFFLGLAGVQPLQLIIEDLHWSDETSLDFLLALARRIRPHPILLLLTYRDDELSPGLRHFLAELDRERLAEEVRLTRLAVDETEAMLRATLGRPQRVRADVLHVIHALTDGNPFFIEEVLKSVSGWLQPFDPADQGDRLPLSELRVPRSVEDAVQRHLARVSPAARDLLALAAVAGRRFDFTLLCALTGRDEPALLPLLKEAIGAQLVVEESAERFAFRHALTRQAIEASLLGRERRTLHATIGAAMARVYADDLDAHCGDLAEHFYEAGAWAEALDYARRAGERAWGLYAPREAIVHFTRALAAATHLPAAARAPLYRARGQAYDLVGEFEPARADYTQALEAARAAGDSGAEWQSLLDLGLLWASRDYAEAGAFFRRALDLAQALADPARHAHSLNRLGNWLVNIGQAAEGLRAHHEAVALYHAQGDRRGMAETHDLLGIAYNHHGDAATAVRHYDKAIDLLRELGDQNGLVTCLATRSVFACPIHVEPIYSALGQPADCRRDAAEAVELARRIGWLSGQAYAEMQAGCVHASFGDLGAGLAHLREARRLAGEIGHQQWLAGALSGLGLIYVWLLAPDRAVDALTTGLRLARELGSAVWLGCSATYLALAYLQQQDQRRAEATLAAVLPRDQSPRDWPERRIAWAWAESALAQGQPAVALRIVDHLIETAPGPLRGQPIPALLRVKGEALLQMQRADEAVPALEEARRGALERQDRPRLWPIHRALGQAYRRLKQHELARREFEAAGRAVEGLAATIDDEELRAHFRRAALATLPRQRPLSTHRAAKQALGGLTAREREVAAWIAQGKTNQEIATALVISERTVESHTASIRAKLDITSRAQLAAWAIAHGLTTPAE